MEEVYVPFGKYKGQSLARLQNDTTYYNWCMAQPGLAKVIQKCFEKTHALTVNILTTTPQSDSCSSEHNKMQCRFLYKSVQHNLITYPGFPCFSKQMNIFIKSDTFLNNFQPHPDITENMERVVVKFEDSFNWDVTLISRNEAYEFIPHLHKLEELEEMKTRMRTQHDISCAETHRLKVLEFDTLTSTYEREMLLYNEKMLEFDRQQCKYEINMKNTQKNHLLIKPIKPHRPYDQSYLIGNYMSNFEQVYEKQFENAWKPEKDLFYEKMKELCTPVCYAHVTEKHAIQCTSGKDILHCCELKPCLGDDYPCVLRKMKQQISSSRKVDYHIGSKDPLLMRFYNYSLRFYLIVGEFQSDAIDKCILKQIFKQSNILVIFMNEIENTTTQQIKESIVLIDSQMENLKNERKRLLDSLEPLVKKLRSDEMSNIDV